MNKKNMHKKMEAYSKLAEEPKQEIKDEYLQEIRKKSFYFVVRQPFGKYQRGEHITDFEEIERIEKENLMSLVIKVNLQKE
jgi:hypothetical protein